MLDDLLTRFKQGDRLALARLITLVARGEQINAIRAGISLPQQPARVVALTGAGGVGKSTLAGKLVDTIRSHGLTVAVLACDPQSPLSGGALLGDRFRMPARADDNGLFVRSLAAAGGRGALAEHLDDLIVLLEAFGFDVVLLETVGAGQGDTAARALVDVLVLLLQPETGDDLQWEKAGLLEVADVVAVHKADLPGADRVEAQILASLQLSAHTPPPVLRVSARGGQGVEELWRAIAGLPLRRQRLDSKQQLLSLAQQELARRFNQASQNPDSKLTALLRGWQGRAAPFGDAGTLILAALLGDSGTLQQSTT